MKRIGILSDTHSCWDDRYLLHFADCDEIWHAGDIGSPLIVERLEEHCPVRAVCGNIDGRELSLRFDDVLHFKVEECNVMMTHIGGYPGNYSPGIRKELYASRPNLFVAGHSHILKVMYDKAIDCLHVNPGAAGRQGWHAVRTLVKLTIDGKEIKDLEVVELS
jgi:putative phosphoesterase